MESLKDRFSEKRSKKETPPVRSTAELILAQAEERTLDWKELRGGTRGIDFSRMYVQRDLELGGGDPGGGYLGKSASPVQVVEYSHAQRVKEAGAVNVTVNDLLPVPFVITPPAAVAVTEGNAPAEGAMVFGRFSPTLNVVSAQVDYTRNLLIQTNPLAREVVQRALLGSVADKLEYYTFHGAGSGEVLGIENAADVDVRTGDTFALATATAMIKAIEDARADSRKAVWIAASDVAELLRKRERASGSGYLVEGSPETLAGRPFIVSPNMQAGYMILGVWSELTYLTRSLEVFVNPMTQSKTGVIEVYCHWYGDLLIRRPGNFSVCTAVT